MNDERLNAGDDELEAYLDGRLDPDARRRFEQSLPHREDRRREVRLQQQIDRRLQNAFVLPPIPPLSLPSSPATDSGSTSSADASSRSNQNGKINGHDRINGHARSSAKPESAPPDSSPNPSMTPPTHHYFDWMRIWRPPTSLVVSGLLTIGALTSWNYLRPSRFFAPPSLEQVYESAADRQLFIEVKPQDDRRFTNAFYYRNRQALKVVNLPADIQIEGLAYVPVLSSGSTVLVAKVQGQPVVVVVDHQRHDRAVPDPGDLRMFREMRGEAMVYEITPLDQPTILPHLQVTEPIERCRPGTEK